MNYLSPAQTYADNKNKYATNKSMDGTNGDYDSMNFMNRNSFLQKSKPTMNSNYLRLMMESSNNGKPNNYDDYHYTDNMNHSQPMNLSQTSNSIPSPSFAQYQNPPQISLSQHKFGLHHNRSNPYEYTNNSGDITFEEYLRESKIKRSRSDNNTYPLNTPMNTPLNTHMNNPMNTNSISTKMHSNNNYYPPEYNNNINSHMANYLSYNQAYTQNGSFNYGRPGEENKTLRMRSYGDNYDDLMKQKYGYDVSKNNTSSMEMNYLYSNLIKTMQQDKRMVNDNYGMKYNYNTMEPSTKKQVITGTNWNNGTVYNTGSTSTALYNETSFESTTTACNSMNDNNGKDHSHQGHDTNCSCPMEKKSDNCEIVVSPSEKVSYTFEKEEELFVFYINYLRKELYNNIREANKRGDASSETNSSLSTPMNVDDPMIMTAKGGNIFNNNAISMNSIPGISGYSGEGTQNNSSQSSYMTSQSDPYCSPPCSPIDRDDHNTDVKYCIHLVLRNGKIESYILLPTECTLCHHSCHRETIVETVAEIYSNRYCRNAKHHCKYCSESECKKKCRDFALSHVSNDDIAIDLETVESFMNKYTSESSDDAQSASSTTSSDVQTLSGGNTSTISSTSPTKSELMHRRSSAHSTKSHTHGNYSDKRSESSATLAMDQSSSFENESKKIKEGGEERLTKSNSSKSSKSVDLQHQRSLNESFLKNYNMYGNDTKSTHALKTPGESIIDAKAKVNITKSDSRHDPTIDNSLEMDSKPGNTSFTSTSSFQEAVANTSTTTKSLTKVMENTSFESQKGLEKYEKHINYKGDPKTQQRLHRAEENRRKIKERIGYERKVLNFLEAHGGEVTKQEDIRELTDIFSKEFSFYGFILRFSMVFAIICAMFSEHSRHVSYTVESFISISKIVVFVIVKNITPITSCISALILYVRFIETMDYETAGERYKIVRHFSHLVRDEEFGQCVDKILGNNLEKVGSKKTYGDSSSSSSEGEEEGHSKSEPMDIDDHNQNSKDQEDLAHIEFKSKRTINSDLPIFPSSSMNERNRNVVIDSYLLFVICLIISHKYTIDTSEYNYKNKSWYFIYTFFLKDYKNPNMTMKQFNQYEFYILCVLQYNIHISMEEYNNFDVFVKRNCSSFGKDLSLYITTNVLDKLSKAMVHQEYYKKLNSNNYKNYIFNSVINNMESKIKIFFEQVIAMVKRNTNEYNRKYRDINDHDMQYMPTPPNSSPSSSTTSPHT